MRMRWYNWTLLLALVVLAQSCASDSATGTFSAPTALAVDSTNDRVFFAQHGGELLAFAASDFSELGGDQPLVSEDEGTDIHALIPDTITHAAAFASGTTSRLFLMGGIIDGDDIVLNQITVLDFDGETFSEADFSPIVISDDDSTTDETDNVFSGLVVDQDNGLVFVTDTSAARLYIFDATDGTTASPAIAIAGRPAGLSAASGRVFVCNTSATAAEQVITVVKISDFTTTILDFDLPCDLVAASTTGAGTVLLANVYQDQQVRIFSVAATDDSVGAISANDPDAYDDGALTNGKGISSVVGGLAAGFTSDGVFHAYVGMQDGYVTYVTIDADLTGFDVELLATAASNVADGAIYQEASTGEGIITYLVAEGGEVLSLEVGSTDVDLHN